MFRVGGKMLRLQVMYLKKLILLILLMVLIFKKNIIIYNAKLCSSSLQHCV